MTRHTIFFLLASLTICTAVQGQTPWNRAARAISVTPAPGGGHELRAAVEFSASDTTTTLDLSTRVAFLVNGTEVAMEELVISAEPAFLGGCEGLDCSGPCICDCTDGACICECGPSVVLTAAVSVSLMPEDEIMVILYPAPGALPDMDESDDRVVQTFHGDPVFWNRRLASVDVQPSSAGGDQFFDVWVETDLQGGYDGFLPLGAEIEILVDGELFAHVPAPGDFDWAFCPGNCSAPCAFSQAGLIEAFCEGPAADCGCTVYGAGQVLIPNVPDGDLEVLLRPVPGALPELPGFEEDDEVDLPRSCPEDLDGDGAVTVSDLLLVLAGWNTPAGDVTGDGNTDVADLLALLAAWGPCFAV